MSNMPVKINSSWPSIWPITSAARSGTGQQSGQNEQRQDQKFLNKASGIPGERPSESGEHPGLIEVTLTIKGSPLFVQDIATQAESCANGQRDITFTCCTNRSEAQEQNLEAYRRYLLKDDRFFRTAGETRFSIHAATQRPNAPEIAAHYRTHQPHSSKRLDVYCSSTTEAKPDGHGRGTYLHRTIDDQPEAQQTAWLIQRTVEKNGRIELPAHGQSMYPFIRKDDLCTFAACPASSLKQGDIALYIAKNGRLIAHRFIRPIFQVHQNCLFSRATRTCFRMHRSAPNRSSANWSPFAKHGSDSVFPIC
ncbi:hypothetical protein QS257_18385 [Terrilactibacillus sp. S3-3]|nr:hypothetical protein QS257_18385 [Terrilactibacillus sp. S3-3]